MTSNYNFLLTAAIASAGLCFTAHAQTYYGNGYTIVEGMDGTTLPDDLDARVFKTINAHTVEEGLRQLLDGSGWTLAGYQSADPSIWRLYNQPYPDNKRTISPMALADALTWIAGNGWELVVDPVNRMLSFEVRPRYAPPPVLPLVSNTATTLAASPVHAPATPTAVSAPTIAPVSASYPAQIASITGANQQEEKQTYEFIEKIEAHKQTAKTPVSAQNPGASSSTHLPAVTAKASEPAPVTTVKTAEPSGTSYTFAGFGKTAQKTSARRNK